MQHARWFVRVLDKCNTVKTHFEPANEPAKAGFSLLIFSVRVVNEKERERRAPKAR